MAEAAIARYKLKKEINELESNILKKKNDLNSGIGPSEKALKQIDVIEMEGKLFKMKKRHKALIDLHELNKNKEKDLANRLRDVRNAYNHTPATRPATTPATTTATTTAHTPANSYIYTTAHTPANSYIYTTATTPATTTARIYKVPEGKELTAEEIANLDEQLDFGGTRNRKYKQRKSRKSRKLGKRQSKKHH